MNLHPVARTTPQIRAEIHHTKGMTQEALAKKYNVSVDTIRKWQNCDVFTDKSHRPDTLQTSLSEIQEAIVVELRKTLFLPLDDLLVLTREFIYPNTSRAGLHRTLRCHGVSNLGNHLFDQLCQKQMIEHRLIRPAHPQTNGMVERFNGRISGILKQTAFASAKELAETLRHYLKLYNYHIPQKNIGNVTPIAKLKEWYKDKPDLFKKKVYDLARPDMPIYQ